MVQKNAPTLADYNYDPVQWILIIFTKLFLDDDKSLLSGGKIFHLTAHMLPRYLVKHNAVFCTNYTAYRKKCANAFISPDLWPPNSPDLNPVDYRIWGLMQQGLYKTPVRDTIDLKKRLVDTWASIPQCVVDETVDQWTARIRACVK